MQLPKKRLLPTRLNPKILLLYGIPKVGKTSSLVQLPDCLIADLEGGSEMYECLRVPVNKASDIDEIAKEVTAMAIAHHKATGESKYPYTYIAIDTVDKLEDLVDAEETAALRKKTVGTKEPFTGSSVTELAYGAGYGYIREGVKSKIDTLSKVCKHLIIISHVKDKYLESKNGIDIVEKDLSLSGKLGGIIAAKADAIGYMYRSGNELRVSFKSIGTTIRGARFPHLAGKDMPFSWDSIFIKDSQSAANAEMP